MQLAELTYDRVKNLPPFEVAVLPLGATEPHNLHLPYGTDTYQVDAIARAAVDKANAAGARVVLLPTLPYGTETNQMDFPLAMNLDPSTVLRVIGDLVASLEHHRIPKCLILNGHGGNELKSMLRELHLKTSVRLFACNWFKVAADRYASIYDDPGDHAGELETSLMLAVRPDLVCMEKADDGATAKTRFEAVNRGWVDITRPWALLTTNSGAGNPHSSTAEKGRTTVEIVVERLSTFLTELSGAEVDAAFPYPPRS